jgi:LytS/YehU family sensor histidine kinase
VLPDGWGGDRPWRQGTAQYFYFPIFNLTNWLLIGGSATFLYADRRAALQTEARLRAAELDRARRSKLALESRLQAMQARIEPQFLFNTLAQVERLYETDRALGARMLDDLIAYLRAAMPLMRDTSSTVAQEIALARAYLDIVRLRPGERLSVDIEAPPGAERMRMPPMMLLPLIDHAIVRGLEPATGSGSIRLRIEPADGRLRVTVCDSGVGFAPEAGSDGIAAIRERLAALYGGDAWLELRRAADTRATEAVLELPLEARGSVDEAPTVTHPGAIR